MAARDSEQRPQSILSLAERSNTKIMSMHKEPECEEPCEGRLSRTVLCEGETPSLYSTLSCVIRLLDMRNIEKQIFRPLIRGGKLKLRKLQKSYI